MSNPIPDMRLPVEVIFNPAWWNKNCGITFERDFFFNPLCRIDRERAMRKYLYERFGDVGPGEKNASEKPVIGPVHLATGFIVSNILGCLVRFNEASPPDVICANMTDSDIMSLKVPDIFKNDMMNDIVQMMDYFENKFGYIEGDLNWSGIQNIALDLRGQELFIDYYENPELVEHLFTVISETLIKFVKYIRGRTGTTSISVNPFVRHFLPSVNLHSNCSVTMISNEIYEKYLLKYENLLSQELQPYGIHHCGNDMHKVAGGYSKVKRANFFDVGWGSDIIICREALPDAFFNLRLSPVRILECDADTVRNDIIRMVTENGSIENAGICCINMDYGTPDDNVRQIFETAKSLRGGM